MLASAYPGYSIPGLLLQCMIRACANFGRIPSAGTLLERFDWGGSLHPLCNPKAANVCPKNTLPGSKAETNVLIHIARSHSPPQFFLLAEKNLAAHYQLTPKTHRCVHFLRESLPTLLICELSNSRAPSPPAPPKLEKLETKIRGKWGKMWGRKTIRKWV
jgi:hypothetical protein